MGGGGRGGGVPRIAIHIEPVLGGFLFISLSILVIL